jgi:gluconokinase
MNYFLGIDIGTTSTKAVAFSPAGEIITSFSIGYEMTHTIPNHIEQNPDEILSAVVTGINKVIEKLSPQLPDFISFSAAMHSLMAVDNNVKPLTPLIIWADNRANDVADNLRKSDKGMNIYHKTGVPIHAMSPLCKLLWFEENEPEIFNSASKFIGIKEYIFYKFFGEYIIDTSVASATGLLNIKTLQWDEEVLSFCNISALKLSTVVPSKHILHYKGLYPELTVPETVPFVIGASDGALSNLGTGATTDNIMTITIGTSGAARMIVYEPCTDNTMRTFCYSVKEGQFILGGGNNNGAVVLQWLKENIFETGEEYEQLFKEAESVNAGSDGLLFLPYLLGERAPLWNSNAKAVFFGLTIQHKKAHMIRAALEGVIFGIYSICKILAENRAVTELRAAGGFARSSLWLQILADVSNVRVAVSGSVESSALGAVMLGAEATGTETNFKNELLTVHEPDQQNHQVYLKSFEKFQRLYDKLKDEM